MISGVNSVPLAIEVKIVNSSVPLHHRKNFILRNFHTSWELLDNCVLAALVKQQSTRYKICFTDRDMKPTNTLVDNQICPICLINWECAAWILEYWKYMQVIYT
ncbi:hypothetical protein F5146DRAFT_929272 [Armillaria mellea]|nr:hypothetical protein F5146DRAFT_929272 [Armillaria mellea]